MARVAATIQVEFETADINQARAALVRLQGGVRHSIQFPTSLGTQMAGLVPGSLAVAVVEKTIDGKPVP